MKTGSSGISDQVDQTRKNQEAMERTTSKAQIHNSETRKIISMKAKGLTRKWPIYFQFSHFLFWLVMLLSGWTAQAQTAGVQTITGDAIYRTGSSIDWRLFANDIGTRGTDYDGIDITGNLTFESNVTLNLVFDETGSLVDWVDSFWDTPVSGTSGWKIFSLTGSNPTITGLDNVVIQLSADQDGDLLRDSRSITFSLHQDGNDIYLQFAYDDLVWTGLTDADWSTASNWSPAFVPTVENKVTIPLLSDPAKFPIVDEAVYFKELIVEDILQLSDGADFSGAGSIKNDYKISFNYSSPTTFAKDITGTGSVEVSFGGVTLTGNNTYSGETVLGGGSLVLGSAGAIGTTGSIIFAGGILEYSSANTTDYSSRFTNTSNQFFQINTGGETITFANDLVSQGGGLTLTGAGKLILAGTDNGIDDSITIDTPSTLEITGSLNSGDFPGVVNVNGIFEFNNGTGNQIFSGQIRSPFANGKFIQKGSARTILTADNTFTGDIEVQSGVLQVGDNATTGTLGNPSSITNNASLVIARSNAFALNKVISGTGSLTIDGDGQFTLQGTQTYIGQTLVQKGELKVDDSIFSSSALSVALGAKVSGTGTLPVAAVAGTHSPGASAGVQLVDGNLTYTAGAAIDWELISNAIGTAGTDYDAIQVTGNLDFAGATALDLIFNSSGSAVVWNNPFWTSSKTGANGWKIFEVNGTVTGLSNVTLTAASAAMDANNATLTTVLAGNAIEFGLEEVIEGSKKVIYLTYSIQSSDASLTNLVVNNGTVDLTLDPIFDPGTLSYTAVAEAGDIVYTLTPTAATGATVTVGGTAVSSGSPSGLQGLSVGINSIDVVVTAADGVTTQTYKVDIIRKPITPAAPTLDGVTASGFDVGINPNGNDPASTTILYSIKVEEGGNTYYVQADGSLAAAPAQVYQTLAAWHQDAGNTRITLSGLTVGATYTVSVDAIIDKTNPTVGSGFGPTASIVTCSNPTDAGVIAADQTICYNTAPAAFTSTTGATGFGGTLEYKWQFSTTDPSGTANWTDIANTDSETYQASALTQTTWFRRLARVSCKADWTGAAESNVLKVTVQPQIVATITAAATSEDVYIGSEHTYTTAAGKSNYIWSIDSPAGGTISAGQGSNNVTITWGQTKGSYKVKVSFTDNGCTSTVAELDVEVYDKAIWNGSSSTDWHTAANWTPAGVPGSDVEIHIPINASRIPESSSDLQLGDITIDTGKDLIVAAGKVLTFAPGKGATGNGRIILKSDGTGDASLGDLSSASAVSVDVVQERYVAQGNRAFRFMSHPFNTPMNLSILAQTIDITGPGGSTNGFTTTATNFPSAFRFDPLQADGSSEDAGWIPFSNLNTDKIQPVEAIRVLIRGSKGQAGSLLDGAYTPDQVTFALQGKINKGTVVKTLRGTTVNGQFSDWNLVGNPYPSPINLQMLSTNLADKDINVWDPRAGDTSGRLITGAGRGGAYVPERIDGSGTFVLPSGSGFFIKALQDNSTLTFNESMKVSGENPNDFERVLRADTRGSKYGPNSMLVTLYSQGDYYDRFILRLRNASADYEEPDDGAKLANPVVNFFTLSKDGWALAVDERSYATEPGSEKIPLWIMSPPNTYTLRVEDFELDGDKSLVIYDRYTDETIRLTKDTSYDFEVTQDPLSKDHRFDIIMGADVVTSLSPYQVQLELLLMPNPADAQVAITFNRLDNPNSSHIRILDARGVVLFEEERKEGDSQRVDYPVNQLAAGVYMVELRQGRQRVVKKLMVR